MNAQTRTTKLIQTISAAALLAALTSGCELWWPDVEGSGHWVAESHEAVGFNRVEVSGQGRVTIVQVDCESVDVETDDNVMPYVRVRVDGQTLRISLNHDLAGGVEPSRLHYRVYVRDLESLRVSGSASVTVRRLHTKHLDLEVTGSGDVRLEDLRADSVNTRISGSGSVDLRGEAGGQEVRISGSGSLTANHLRTSTTNARLSGSGSATVWVTGCLWAKISGSGSLDYFGQPKVSSDVSGSGDLRARGNK